tara:strand:- start:156 stop:380 length:225 start_codon:yes stop_codon:yes gene_type:complete
MTRQELIQAVKDHALENYTQGGWDVIVECWDSSDIDEAIEGARTLRGAIRKLQPVVGVWSERQAEARMYREDAW